MSPRDESKEKKTSSGTGYVKGKCWERKKPLGFLLSLQIVVPWYRLDFLVFLCYGTDLTPWDKLQYLEAFTSFTGQFIVKRKNGFAHVAAGAWRGAESGPDHRQHNRSRRRCLHGIPADQIGELLEQRRVLRHGYVRKFCWFFPFKIQPSPAKSSQIQPNSGTDSCEI